MSARFACSKDTAHGGVLWLIIVFASSEPPPGTFAINTVSLLGIFIPDLIP
jgi:hypothetical protein